jgi:hypothetical protein
MGSITMQVVNAVERVMVIHRKDAGTVVITGLKPDSEPEDVLETAYELATVLFEVSGTVGDLLIDIRHAKVMPCNLIEMSTP